MHFIVVAKVHYYRGWPLLRVATKRGTTVYMTLYLFPLQAIWPTIKYKSPRTSCQQPSKKYIYMSEGESGVVRGIR